MEHIQVSIAATGEQQEVLIALLADIGYDGFEDAGKELLAYIGKEVFDEAALTEVTEQLGVTYTIAAIPDKNWNELWESNFQPVVVDDFCTIRADFHTIEVTTPYEIVITPKMSFGTGHHATTRLMMMAMRDMDLAGRTVLDFGTGTGVLAILAHKLGAATLVAIDNDEWSVTNAIENTERNNCTSIQVLAGSLPDAPTLPYSVILANINRHILLEHMELLYGSLTVGGRLLLSGLLIEDKGVIKEAAEKAGFTYNNDANQSGWLAIMFEKR